MAGILKKQQGRQPAVYTSQSDLLLGDLSLEQNLSYFIRLGSVNRRMVNQMIVSFGLSRRTAVLARHLTVSEKHITQIILALAGSNRTVILDEPFTGLTQEQTLKLVKIIRQKNDCTLIVTAKSKASIEMLQPHQVLTI